MTNDEKIIKEEELRKYVSSIIENDIFAALNNKIADDNQKAKSNKQNNNTNKVYDGKNTIKSSDTNKKRPNPALAKNINYKSEWFF